MDEDAAGIVLIPDRVIGGGEVNMAETDSGLNVKGLKNSFPERKEKGFVYVADGHDVDMDG